MIRQKYVAMESMRTGDVIIERWYEGNYKPEG
jgi:hypothetical protein